MWLEFQRFPSRSLDVNIINNIEETLEKRPQVDTKFELTTKLVPFVVIDRSRSRDQSASVSSDRSHFGVAGQRRPGPLDSLASGRENRIDDRCQVRTTLTWNPVLDRIADTPEGAAHRRSDGRWARTPLVTVQADEVIGGGWRDELARSARARGNDRFPL